MSIGHRAPDTWRFPTALGAALAAHVLLALSWETLPFARATEQSPFFDDGLSSLAVQLVAPAPPPAPAPVTPEPPPPPPPKPKAKPEPTAPRREAAENQPKRSEGIPQSLRASKQDKPHPDPTPKIESVISAKEQSAPRTAAIEKKPEPKSPARAVVESPTPPPKPRAAPTPETRPPAKPPSALPSGPPAPPSYRTNPKPHYPSEARIDHSQGTSYLRVEVLASGAVGRVTIIKSSGHASLDAAAVKTVSSRWRFHPARRGGIAVPAVVTVPIRFQLR